MIKRSSPSSENKAWQRAAAWVARYVHAFGDQIFANDDEVARQHGWEVARARGGLSRRYHDPRVAALRSCPWCQGSGLLAERDCPPCRGTGRLARPVPPGSSGGEDDGGEPLAQAQ